MNELSQERIALLAKLGVTIRPPEPIKREMKRARKSPSKPNRYLKANEQNVDQALGG